MGGSYRPALGFPRMSAIFQRPLCEMGAAYDFGFRPLVGEPLPGSGGPCDDRPRRIELCSALLDGPSREASWRGFLLCPEHESQLRQYDERLRASGRASRFRGAPGGTGPGSV